MIDKDSRKLTVSVMSEICQRLIEHDKGDMELSMVNESRPLYDDELSYNYSTNRIEICRGLWNDEFTDKAEELKSDIKKAVDKFWGIRRG